MKEERGEEDQTYKGITRAILFPQKLYSSINEYRTYVKNKTGFYPKFSESVRLLLKEALINRKAYEPSNDDEDCKE